MCRVGGRSTQPRPAQHHAAMVPWESLSIFRVRLLALYRRQDVFGAIAIQRTWHRPSPPCPHRPACSPRHSPGFSRLLAWLGLHCGPAVRPPRSLLRYRSPRQIGAKQPCTAWRASPRGPSVAVTGSHAIRLAPTWDSHSPNPGEPNGSGAWKGGRGGTHPSPAASAFGETSWPTKGGSQESDWPSAGCTGLQAFHSPFKPRHDSGYTPSPPLPSSRPVRFRSQPEWASSSLTDFEWTWTSAGPASTTRKQRFQI